MLLPWKLVLHDICNMCSHAYDSPECPLIFGYCTPQACVYISNKSLLLVLHILYYLVVTWARVVCLIYAHTQTQGPRPEGVYISGKP